MHASYETIKLNKTLFFLKELLPIDLLGYYLKTKRYQITKLMCDYLSSHLAKVPNKHYFNNIYNCMKTLSWKTLSSYIK